MIHYRMEPLVGDPSILHFSGTFLDVSISLCFSHLEGALGVAALPRRGVAQGCVLGGELGGSPGSDRTGLVGLSFRSI